jgi:hypothetical protein
LGKSPVATAKKRVAEPDRPTKVIIISVEFLRERCVVLPLLLLLLSLEFQDGLEDGMLLMCAFIYDKS